MKQGQQDIEEDVFLSMPCVLSANGVTHIVQPTLTATEKSQLQKSAQLLAKIQADIQF